MEGESLQ
jgi:hypothetical protein